MKLNIPARAIAFTAPFMDSSDIRWYLNGVFVRAMTTDEGGGVLFAGANGPILGLWREDGSAECERPVVLRVTPELVAACRKNTHLRAVTIVGDRLTVIETKTGVTPTEMREVYIQPGVDLEPEAKHSPWELPGGAKKYPDVLSVLKSAKQSGVVCKLRSEYVKTVSRAFSKAAGNAFGAGVSILQSGEWEPTVVVSEDVPQAVAMIMPMRPNSDQSPVPTWFDKATSAAGRVRAAKAAPLPVHEPSDAGPPDGDGRGWSFVKGEAA